MEKNRVFSENLASLIPDNTPAAALEWLSEQMPGGFFIYRADASTELLYVNHAVCDIYGCDNMAEFRELTGNSFRGMVYSEDYESIQNSIDDQIADQSNIHSVDHVIYRIARKDGEIRWVDDYGHFATLPDFGDVYYVFIEDITGTMVADQERKKNLSLEQALKDAEQANNAKIAFLSNMSHEIRTPITAILGMNEMIQRESDEPSILEYSGNIQNAGVSLLGIISDILDFSKIETGKMELSEAEYSLSVLVRDLFNLIRFRTEAKGLELTFRIDPALPSRLIGDEIRVKQIIANLLTNAVKYTESGSIVFEMAMAGRVTGNRGEDEVSVAVSVTDTGIGIRAEDMDRLFEPFDRLNLKKTRTIEGTGLGLAITRQLLSVMDSKLEVESRYGEGSRFYFTLSQKVADGTAVGEIDRDTLLHGSNEKLQQKSFFTAPGIRILVVDDTPMNLQVISGLLKRTKMRIDVAVSGAECIEKFEKNDYDMIFLDYRMPHMNGIETLAELIKRNPEKVRSTPIISLTASAVSGDREKMLKAGFTDYLSKPVNIEEMERTMLKYLPADAVIMSEGEEENDEFSKLPALIFEYPELDPKKGIDYCGDAEDYIFALDTFALSVDTKAEQIEKNLKEHDIDAYTINVHSLKSTSGAIGAGHLSERAKALESAGKQRDYETISRDTPALLEEYRKLKDILRSIIKAYEMPEVSSKVPLAVVEEERNRMLSRALAEAEQANMAKTAFVSNMSHEIRTPMNAIMGLYSIALKKPGLDPDIREIFTKIGESTRHLLALINDILDISRIESGNIQLKQEPFNFGDMIEQINTMTEAQCIEKGLVFECRVNGHTDDSYIGDDMKLKQVLINIMSNAIKYTDSPGNVTFALGELERGHDMAKLRFCIKDTGKGIDPDYLPKLFEPFSKDPESGTDSYESTGLGLTITKNIVDLMGGSIEVRSEKGKGSEFTVVIPLSVCSDGAQEGAGDDLENMKLLVVDDDPEACEHARKVFLRVGMTADYAMSGQEALSMLERQRSAGKMYRLLLIDWKMPQMDGIELTREIRKRFAQDDPTIILTTYNWDEIMEEALFAGVDAFLAKPLFAGSIREEIRDILSGRKKFAEAVSGVPLAGKRILLAEDMDINAQIVKQILLMKGIDTDIAGNGKEAVELFQKSAEDSYDAILMDIRMPELDGLEAAKQIRALKREDAGKIPIIALTANAFEEDVKLSLEAGMNAHLSKPIEPDVLFATLEKLLDISGNGREDTE